MSADVSNLIELECQGKWKEAKDMLLRKWHAESNNLNVLLRLITECWYVLMMWDCCMPQNELNYDDFQLCMQKALEYGNSHFLSNSLFLSVVGYLMVQTPNLFAKNETDEAYAFCENQGRKMMKTAIEITPENALFRILYSGFSDDHDTYRRTQKLLSDTLHKIEWDQSKVSQYFKYIVFSSY